jgi:hypothetical protein
MGHDDDKSFANGNAESNGNSPQPARRRDWQTRMALAANTTFWGLV